MADAPPLPTNQPRIGEMSDLLVRSIFQYYFEDGTWIECRAYGNVPTGTALDMADELIAMKRRELLKPPSGDQE